MEGTDTQAPSEILQTETVKKVVESQPAESSESVIKSAPVSVIQALPAKANGATEVVESNGHGEGLTNGAGEQQEQQENLDIQHPSEQLPAELLQEDSSLTTVASLIDSAEEPEVEPTVAEEEKQAEQPVEAVSAAEKKSASQLASEWETEEAEEEKTAEAADAMAEDNKDESAVEQKDEQGADKDDVSPRKSGRKVKPTEKVLEAENMEEESVEAIAKELATTGSEEKKKPAKTTPKKSGKEGEQLSADEDSAKKTAKKGRPKKKDLDEKVDNVTKLGNNMYFYTGPGGQDSPPPLTSDDEDLDLDGLKSSDKNEKEKDAAAEAARKSNRAGKGRNPRLEREDEEVEIPKKVPAKPNLNPSWLKTAAKDIAKKTPVKTPAKKKTPAAVDKAEPAEAVEAAAGAPEAAAPATEAATDEREASPPKDEELPEFDPEKFTPGYVPQTVKKGDAEYLIVVEGVKDTGLCGKYWGDLENLPSRRRSTKPEILTPGKPSGSPEPGAKGRRGSVGSTGSVETPGKKGPKKQDTPAAPKSTKKQLTKPEVPKRAEDESAGEAEEKMEEGTEGAAEAGAETPVEPEKKKRGRKRKVDIEAAEKAKKQKSSQAGDDSMTEPSDAEGKDQKKKKGSPEKTAVSSRNAAAVSAALAAGVPAGQQRSVSCVSDTSTQKEVVVECFAPYDDHRWVNIGKERDGMTPDAVQYARALRPPYHLLSFLRIKGHSTKGMSCTDKNTMVFVVLEGEITVILHTTQFNAKKGDSFYIPPKNYYNLINQKAREAELSLIQFQYDGPLPTVNPSTQSQ